MSAALKSAKAFIVGWTGACGDSLSKELARRNVFQNLVLIGRRKVELEPDDPRINCTQEVVDFEKLDEHKLVFSDCAFGYCALGTTMTESGKDGLKKVDYDYIMGVAKLAKESGCKEFHLISTVNASEDSWYYYFRLKGQVEREITELKFDKLVVYRPGLLLRKERARGIEKFNKLLLKPVTFFKPRWGQITVDDVARSIVAMTVQDDQNNDKSVKTLSNSEMHSALMSLQ